MVVVIQSKFKFRFSSVATKTKESQRKSWLKLLKIINKENTYKNIFFIFDSIKTYFKILHKNIIFIMIIFIIVIVIDRYFIVCLYVQYKTNVSIKLNQIYTGFGFGIGIVLVLLFSRTSSSSTNKMISQLIYSRHLLNK